uniref:Uncharacterized protein LOC111132429 n=1 Tax=Crassostrea virginica TaxID=6565 RepID=A0A8B8E5R7_CRAVI|nr:uncharacterized protein LOC111132429 [Crassostrea virginica]
MLSYCLYVHALQWVITFILSEIVKGRPSSFLLKFLHPAFCFLCISGLFCVLRTLYLRHLYQYSGVMAPAQPVVVQQPKKRCADKILLNICISLFFPPWIVIWCCMCICT